MAKEIKSINGQPLMDEVARLQIEEINENLNDKVDKEEGKSLISDDEITRLADIDNYDDTEIKESIGNIEETIIDIQENYATKDELQEGLANIDLTEYATKEEVSTKIDDVAINEEETTDYQTAMDFFSDGEKVTTVYFTGGSSTSSTAPYISTTLPENAMVSTGESFDLHLDFSSPNLGKGTVKVFINDIESLSMSIIQGDSTTPIPSELLSKGQNKVVVYVLDRVGMMSNSLTFYVRYGSLELISDFDVYTAYDYGSVVRYYFTPTAVDTSLSLTMYMSIDGQTQLGVDCVSDTRGYYTFPSNLSVGKHLCKAWVRDSNGGTSNELVFNLIIIDNMSLVVASDTQNVSIEEGEQLSLDYKVYMKGESTFNVYVFIDGKMINKGTCGLATSYYKTSSLTEGIHTIKIEVYDITEIRMDYVTWTIEVTPSTYQMKTPTTAGATLIATAKNKSNADENREIWVGTNQDGERIEAELVNFSFNEESGWGDDQLLITGDSYVEIPIAPLSENAKYGFTLDIEFSTKPIGVEDALVLDLWDEENNCGIKITTEELIMQSKAGNRCDLYFEEDTMTSAMFVIDRHEKTAKVYLNGVMCEAFHLTDYEANGVKYLEDFTVTKNIKLGGSGHTAIKNIRVYQVALTTNEIINNFISNETVKSKQKELVEFQKGNDLPTMTIYCDFSGLGKDDKKPCDIVYVSTDTNKYGQSFTIDGKYSQLQYQGTSSMAYPIKNYRINPRDRNGKKKINPFIGGKPESRFTLKADFITSNHAHNTGMAKFISDKLYNYNDEDEKTMNPMRWHLLHSDGDVSTIRETINGFPIRLILVNDGSSALNEGQAEPTPGNTKDMGIFNFNNDKDNLNSMGMDTKIFPNCVSYEVTANSDTSAGAFIPYSETFTIEMQSKMQNTTTLYENWATNFLGEGTFTIGEEVPLGKIVIYGYKQGTQQCHNNYGNSRTLTLPSGIDQLLIRITDLTATQFSINGVVYKIQSVDTEPNHTPFSSGGSELSYLQDSFELRYPDAKEVGEDYGYLGIPIREYTVKLKGDTMFYIPMEHFTERILTIEYVQPENNFYGIHLKQMKADGSTPISYSQKSGSVLNIADDTIAVGFYGIPSTATYIIINGIKYHFVSTTDSPTKEDPIIQPINNPNLGLKRVIDWVGNCSDEEFVRDFELYFNKHYTFRYYLLVVLMAGVDNLGKNMMLDTWDGQIWYPRFYDIDTILSYDNSGEIKFEADIEMEQGYWNTSSSRLWTKVRDLFHDELIETYKNMRANGVTYENIMHYMYDEQIAKIPQTYYNMDYDIKYAPYSDQYLGKAHGDGLQHMKRWLKRRFLFCDTLYDYAPSYNNDVLTIRANTTEEMTIEIETYSPVYQHLSWYNGQMDKQKIDGKTSVTFSGYSQTATDQEVLIYGGSNIKSIKGISSMNPNSMLIGGATRLTELDVSNCPILSIVNSNKANFSPHTYLNKLNISNCPQLGGNLNVSNSPLLQEINAKGSGITGLLMPTSLRNLKTLRLPNTLSELTLHDVPLLNTLEFDEGANLQSISLTNCNQLDNCINFDLTKTPSVFLDNSYNTDELYMSATTDLTLKNMPTLERVIFTPNNEYSEFDINNVLNAPNYKVTTFNNPNMTGFIVTAPHRYSYTKEPYKEMIKGQEGMEKIYYKQDINIIGGVNYLTGEDIVSTELYRTDYIKVQKDEKVICLSDYIRLTDYEDCAVFYDINKQYVGYCNYATGEYTVQKDGYMRIRVGKNSSYNEIVKHFTLKTENTWNMTKDITPNTVFTANTLDLSDTQFTDIKFLSTTDVYNLKVPTSMKNFYCDSAMDIDEDVIVDGGYDVIHNELVEPYTTNYEGEVKKYEDVTQTITQSDMTLGQLNNAGVVNTSDWCYVTDYIPILGGSQFAITVDTDSGSSWTRTLNICGYDSSKKFVNYYHDAGVSYKASTEYKFTVDSNVAYVRLSMNGDNHILKTKTVRIPNLIPSSANGSLIFNMYSNNTTQPTSTSPYMWDLTGLKLNDFHTYGMNNRVKPSDDSYETIPSYKGLICNYGKYNNGGTINTTYFDSGQMKYRVIGLFELNPNTYTVATNLSSTPMVLSSSSPTGTVKLNWTNGKVTFTEKTYLLFYCDEKNTNTGELLKWVQVGDYKYYLDRIPFLDVQASINILDYTNGETCAIMESHKEFVGATSITMPQRMSGYSIRMVNADITPNEYATHLYPLLVDTTLPITGKLDYTKYNGNTLAWAYAYTTSDVTINPLDSRYQGNITNDYNKLYGTDYIDITDAWIYKDTDISNYTANGNITKIYVELTSDNKDNRIGNVLPLFPNCKEVYFFEDGTVTSLSGMFQNANANYKKTVEKVIFMEGYFTANSYSMRNTFGGCVALKEIVNMPLPSNLQATFQNCEKLNQQFDFSAYTGTMNMSSTFQNCKSLTYTPILSPKVTDMINSFGGCSSLVNPPILPSTVTGLQQTFKDCKSLKTAPTIPNNGKITTMNQTFYNCASLTKPPTIPDSVTNLESCFEKCSNMTTAPNIPNSVTKIGYMCSNCSKITSITIPLGNITSYSNALVNCTALTNITWVGQQSSDFSLTTLGCPSYTQADTQELVPEHLVDNYISEINLTGSGTITVDGVVSTVTTDTTLRPILIGKRSSNSGDSGGNARLYKVIMDGVTFIPVLDNNGTPCMMRTDTNKFYYDTLGGTVTQGHVLEVCDGYTKLNYINCVNAFIFVDDMNLLTSSSVTYYIRIHKEHVSNTRYVVVYGFALYHNGNLKKTHVQVYHTQGWYENTQDSDGNAIYLKNSESITSPTLTLGTTYLGYLTEDEIAGAVGKGWTLQ